MWRDFQKNQFSHECYCWTCEPSSCKVLNVLEFNECKFNPEKSGIWEKNYMSRNNVLHRIVSMLMTTYNITLSDSHWRHFLFGLWDQSADFLSFLYLHFRNSLTTLAYFCRLDVLIKRVLTLHSYAITISPGVSRGAYYRLTSSAKWLSFDWLTPVHMIDLSVDLCRLQSKTYAFLPLYSNMTCLVCLLLR